LNACRFQNSAKKFRGKYILLKEKLLLEHREAKATYEQTIKEFELLESKVRALRRPTVAHESEPLAASTTSNSKA